MSARSRAIAHHISWLACGVFLHVVLAVAGVGSTRERAGRAEADMDSLRLALELYQERHGDYPEALDALVADGILARTPRDPWGYDYQYLRKGEVIVIMAPSPYADYRRTLRAPPARTSP